MKSGYTNTFRAYMNVKDKAIGQVGPFESNDITINYVTKADLNSVTKMHQTPAMKMAVFMGRSAGRHRH